MVELLSRTPKLLEPSYRPGPASAPRPIAEIDRAWGQQGVPTAVVDVGRTGARARLKRQVVANGGRPLSVRLPIVA